MSRLSLRVRLLLAVGLVAVLALALADVVVYTSLRSYLYGQVDATLQVAQQSVEAAASAPPATDPPGTAAPPQGDQQPTGADFCAIGRESAPGMFIEVLTAEGGVVSGDECPAFAPGHKAYSPKLTSVVAPHAAGTTSRETAPYFTVASTAGGPSFRVHTGNCAVGISWWWPSRRQASPARWTACCSSSSRSPPGRWRSQSWSGCGSSESVCARCETWSGRRRRSRAVISSIACPRGCVHRNGSGRRGAQRDAGAHPIRV